MTFYNLPGCAVGSIGLVDSVVAFANAKISNPRQVVDYFPDNWLPKDIPQLRACRDTQRDVRAWLLNPDAFNMMIGSSAAMGVRLAASPKISTSWTDDADRKMTTDISWNLYVQQGSLRAICMLAVLYLFDEGLADKTHLCAHAKCNNLFVDTKSRGTTRKYCHTDECDSVRNREYVAASKKKGSEK